VHGAESTLKRSFLPPEWLAAIPAVNHSIAPSAAPTVPRRAQDLRRLALALKQTRGNVAEAASLLGFSRHQAYRLINGREVAEFLANEPPETGADPQFHADRSSFGDDHRP
jgi:Bacterial regulatory protein, Fis family